MTVVKRIVLGEIENGVTANNAETFCTCQYTLDHPKLCNHCVVDYALRRAKACIIASSYKDVAIGGAMDSVQEIIEKKVRLLVEEEPTHIDPL